MGDLVHRVSSSRLNRGTKGANALTPADRGRLSADTVDVRDLTADCRCRLLGSRGYGHRRRLLTYRLFATPVRNCMRRTTTIASATNRRAYRHVSIATGVRGYQFRRNHRLPGAHPLARRRFSAQPEPRREGARASSLRFATSGAGGSFPSSLMALGCVRPIAFPVEDEGLRTLSEAFGDHLGVERVREDLGPILERSIGGDQS